MQPFSSTELYLALVAPVAQQRCVNQREGKKATEDGSMCLAGEVTYLNRFHTKPNDVL